MDETLYVQLPPWFAISNSTLKGNHLKKILTFIEILENFIQLKMDVVILRYFNFEPSFKLRWCCAQDLFGSQMPVTTGGFEL